MRLNALSSFAAGILLATSISGAVYFSTKSEAAAPVVQKKEPQTEAKQTDAAKPESEEAPKKQELTEEEMKNKLESAGYMVQKTEEFEKQMEEVKKESEKEKTAKTKQVVVFQVSKGMTSIDVGKILEKAKLVDDDFKFSQDVEKKGVANRLKPGMYKVDSEMTKDELISAIFKK